MHTGADDSAGSALHVLELDVHAAATLCDPALRRAAAAEVPAAAGNCQRAWL